MSRGQQLVGVFLRVILRRPGLGVEAVRFALATAPHRWFRSRPFIPLPDPSYRDWRLGTAYGQSDASVTVGEMEEFLRWRKSLRRVT